MPDVGVLAVLVATVAVFALGGVYYGILGGQLAAARGAAASAAQPAAWQTALVEVVRSLVLVVVLAGLAARGDVGTWGGGLVLGVVLWVGFPLVLWTGAIFHERTPVRLAAIHAGDWLVKLVVAGAIVAGLQ